MFLFVSSSNENQNPQLLNLDATNSQSSVPNKSWTLFVYSSLNPDQDFIKNKIENIDSKDACIQSGLAYTKTSGSYECAYGCEYRKEYKSEICERTCDHGGCRE